ncbi:MAG TPA: AmmeMemoRadiSam system protein B, partial [Elusimicrobiales bacterium]|nr:AmmeMemoRadiSam system protein B [Elusimicrobiales bacterium]
MKIRKAAVAGRFYEADPDKLRKEVNSYMGDGGKADGTVLGILVPHAGYAYSGAVAGTAFSFLRGMNFDTAVIIGTAHTEAVRGASILTTGSFETPLGLAEIDAELAGELMLASGLFEERPSAHLREHSIEVELPFLQALGRPFRFVPVLVNTEDIGTLQELGRVIGRKIKGRKAVVCVSSDLSHYPPGGLAERSDLSLLAAFQTAVRNGNLEHFALANSLLLEAARGAMDTAACGFAAMAVGAAACMEAGADDYRLLRYTHSGKISGDNGGVVGYGAGLFTAGGKRAPR